MIPLIFSLSGLLIDVDSEREGKRTYIKIV